MSTAGGKPEGVHFHPCECGMPIRCYGARGHETACHSCALGQWSRYLWGYLPRDCCLLNARRVRKDELDVYRLSGPVENWWICPDCKRCFGVKPELMEKWEGHHDCPAP